LTLVVGKDPFQPVAEAFRNLRTSIQFSAVDEPVRTLLVTSPLPTDGKTFTAANLAAVMAQGGRDVILVDSDLRRSVQHRVFGLPKEPGVTSALLSPEEQGIALRETDVKGLKVVTGGARAPNPAELLASDRFQDFVAWLKEQADVVIFDSPPVLAVTDAAVLSTVVDATLLVVDHGRTRRAAAAQATERLMNVGGNLLGIVLNRLPPNGDGYYYYHYYYYGDGKEARNGGGKGWIDRLLNPRNGRSGANKRRRKQKKTEGK
jgi:capsular exopolysaccharide synthesis family protein